MQHRASKSVKVTWDTLYEHFREDIANLDELEHILIQRYLATKHQHLKKASEQLLTNRPSEFRQSLGLPPYQPPPRPPTGPSLIEDKNLMTAAAAAVSAAVATATAADAPSGSAASAEPPQLYKSNLAKSHDELLSLSTKENQDEVLHPPLGGGTLGGGSGDGTSRGDVGGSGGSQPSSQGALTIYIVFHIISYPF